MTWINFSFWLVALLVWGVVAWAFILWAWNRPDIDPENGSDEDGGISPLDNPSGPEIDWGAWEKMDTREETMV